MTSPDCSESAWQRIAVARRGGASRRRNVTARLAAARCAALAARRRVRRARRSSRSSSRTSASRACSAPKRARSSATCRSRSATRVDDEKAAPAVKALYATGFFRDVRLEVEDDVLVVIVQERPTISKIDIVGNKEFDKDTLKKALKDIGVAEARIFDRSALDRAEQEIKRQYIIARPLRGEGDDDGHAAGAQPRRRSTSPSRRATRRRSRGINIVGNKALHRERAAQRDAR